MSSYTPGDLERVTGVSRRQLQHWRKIGLVTPTHRTTGGHSRYSEGDLLRVRIVLALRRAGVGGGRLTRAVGSVVHEVERILSG